MDSISEIFMDAAFAPVTPTFQAMPLRIRSGGHFRITPKQKQSIRICSFIELFWCIDGSALYRYPEGEYTLHSGEVCFFNCGCPHDYLPAETGFHYWWLSIEGDLIENLFHGFNIRRTPHFAGVCPSELFIPLMKLLRTKTVKAQYDALGIGFSILTKAVMPENDTLRHNDYAASAKLLIDENFSNSETTISLLAEQLQTHRVYLSRLFKRKFGIPVSEYLLKKRIDYAMELLLTTDLPLGAISLNCGIPNLHYFMRFFKKRAGTTPAQWRMKQKWGV